jgi:hypothetical protein
MKRSIVLFSILCVLLVVPGVFAQNQQAVRVYIAPVEDGTEEEMQYFSTNMRMEFIGASYEVVDTLSDSNFNLTLSVSRREDEMIEEESPAAPETPGQTINSITLTLFDTKTNREIITLSWDYQQLSDMDMWNLYLISQAMSNAPISKTPAGASPPPPAPAPKDHGLLNNLLWIGLEGALGYAYPSDGPFAGATLTVELDFLPFLGVSTGFGFQALFPLGFDTKKNENDETEYEYSHGITYNFTAPFLIKFFIDTGTYLVIPCVGAEFNLGGLGFLSDVTPRDSQIFMPAIIAGIDFRLAAGPGALDIGANAIYDFDVTAWGFEFIIGYKFGLFKKNR